MPEAKGSFIEEFDAMIDLRLSESINPANVTL